MNDRAPSLAPDSPKAARRTRYATRLTLAAPALILAMISLLLTICVSAIVIWTQHEYLARATLRYDAVYYQFYNARLFTRLVHEGTWDVVLSELRNNWRHPLRTLPLILLAPDLLASPVGHLATAAPALLAFLLILGMFLYRRTGSVLYGVAGMVAFCSTGGLYLTHIGFGAYWAEPVAALLLGSAVLSLLCSDEGRDLRWLALFALFASLATLSRYVVAMYIFVVAGPILGLYLARRGLRERGLVRPVLLPALLVGGVVGLLAGPFLVAQFGPNMSYYGSRGYALFSDLFASAYFVLRAVALLLGPAQALALLALCGAYCLIGGLDMRKQRVELVVSLWAVAAVPLYSAVVLRIVDARHSLWYAVPVIVAALLAPFTPLPERPIMAALRRLAGTTLVVGAILGGWSAWQALSLAQHPTPDAAAAKTFALSLGRSLAAAGDRVVWSPFFDENSHIPSMEAFYDGRGLPIPVGASYFSIHSTYWHTDFPGATPDEVARRVYTATSAFVDLAVVFADPADAQSARWLDNDYSRAVAGFMASQLAADPGWALVETFEDTPFGDLALYRNQASKGGSYEAFLLEDGRVRP